MQREPGKHRPETSWVRHAGLGVELVAAIVGFALVGFWIDRSFDTGPWGLLVCVLVGLVGGFYNFIRSSLHVLRRPVDRDRGGSSSGARGSDRPGGAGDRGERGGG